MSEFSFPLNLHEILYNFLSISRLSFLYVTELLPFIYVRIIFPLNILRTNGILYNFMMTISRLGLLPVIFRKFVTELWPLIYVRIFV